MPSIKNKPSITVYVDKELDRKLRLHCLNTGKTMTNAIVQAIEFYLANTPSTEQVN